MSSTKPITSRLHFCLSKRYCSCYWCYYFPVFFSRPQNLDHDLHILMLFRYKTPGRKLHAGLSFAWSSFWATLSCLSTKKHSRKHYWPWWSGEGNSCWPCADHPTSWGAQRGSLAPLRSSSPTPCWTSGGGKCTPKKAPRKKEAWTSGGGKCTPKKAHRKPVSLKKDLEWQHAPQTRHN